MSPVSRRRVLVAGGTGLCSLIAGCKGASLSDSLAGPSAYADQWKGPTPGRGEALTVQETVTDDATEYAESNDTVRYVYAHRREDRHGENVSNPTRIPVFERTTFEDWAETKSAHIGADAVLEHLKRRLGSDISGVSTSVNTEDEETVITVALETWQDREGNNISTPSVEFRQVSEVTPAKVTVTITLEGRSYTVTLPVVVRERTYQYA